MKKILFIQNKGKTYGGVWQVNKLVGEELIKRGYDVAIVSFRETPFAKEEEHSEKLKVFTINKKAIWGTYSGEEILNEIKNIRIFKAIKMVLSRFIYFFGYQKDIKKMRKIIRNMNPDYIITSHYQMIDTIPKEYLKKTIHEQHSSFSNTTDHKATIKTLLKYKDKIKFLWLTQKTMENAKEYGLVNSDYIYNAVRITSKEISNVTKHKKLVTIARLSDQKNLDRMIDVVKTLFEDKKYKDWSLEIYGTGEEEEKLRKLINNHPQIKLMGLTKNPKEVLLKSSINLNTSKFEGFCLSILEANECGVPTVSYDFGESVEEEIKDGKTGFIANNKEEYLSKLKSLIDNPKKLTEMSKNCKEFSKNFQIDKIMDKWEEYLNK